MTGRTLFRGKGPLAVIALLLAASGALRIGLGIGEAVANAPALSSEPMVCPAPPMAVVEALSEREKRVRVQEAAIANRMAALAFANKAIDGRLAALNTATQELSKTIALADGAAENDLSRLTSVYEAMKPKEAAALFAAMSPDFAAGFLARMKPEAAAGILGSMPADKAYAMSVILAGRNARAPTE